MSTQEVALGEVIELAFEYEQIRILLKIDCIRCIGLLRQNRGLWYNLPQPIQSRAQRALISLADEIASIKELVFSLQSLPEEAWPIMESNFKSCLL